MKAKMTQYAAMAVLVVVLAGADLAYFSSLPDKPAETTASAEAGEPLAPLPELASGGQAAADCGYNPEKSPISDWRELVSFSDPSKGNPGAPVTVIVYFDPNCPHCKSLDPIIEEVIEEHRDDARFVFKAFPLWQYSVWQVQALYAAAQEGKFFEMMDRQFQLQQQGGLGPDVLRAIAEEIGMNAETMVSRIQAGLYDNLITNDRQKGIDRGINSMPTVIINGRFVAGTSRSKRCLSELIEEAGAGS